ncbi:amine-terminal region of a tm vesicle-mediated sorter, partial [Cystoisospora suis]
AWQSGILGTFEKPRASLVDQDLYLKAWPLKLLHTTIQTVGEEAVLDARLHPPPDEGRLQSSPERHGQISEGTQTTGEYRGASRGQEGGEGEGQEEEEETPEMRAWRILSDSSMIDQFCQEFEDAHSLQTIYILRSKAFIRLRRLRDEIGAKKAKKSPFKRLWNFITFGKFGSDDGGAGAGGKNKKGGEGGGGGDLSAATTDPEELASASRKLFEGVFKYVSREEGYYDYAWVLVPLLRAVCPPSS